MITWTVGLTVRPGRREEWIELSNELTTSSHALDDGCVVYLCLADPDDPLEFLWYEQWDGEEALRTHVARLHTILSGPATPPATLPPRLDALLGRREVTAWRELQAQPPAPADRRSPAVTRVTYADATGRPDDVLWELTRSALQLPGCVTYVWHRAEADDRRLFCFEQWADEASYDAFVERADPPAAVTAVATIVSDRRHPVVA